MAKKKFDGVVEAVHYKSNGEVDWVRAYERRGPTFSDHLLIEREALIERLKSGKNFMVGRRVQREASTFDVTQPLRVVDFGGRDALVVGQSKAEQDSLEGVPVI
jgi:hypothetical protein